MAVSTFSVFYYGAEIVNEIRYLNIRENAGPEITVELRPGVFSLTEFAEMVETAFNNIGTLGYEVTVDRQKRFITITSASGTWEALIASGSLGLNQAWSYIGFVYGSDLVGADNYTSNSPIGEEFKPQFWLQDFIPSNHFKKASEATQKKTATGRVEVVTFGQEKFIEANIKFATNVKTDGKIIRNRSNGRENLQAFMDFAITKNIFEFMLDENDRDTFETVILEKTMAESTGIGFKLIEMNSQQLPGFYETGVFTLRVIE